jgi:nucleotide-binding universal stress UspA family protein
MFTRILVGLDGSEGAKKALEAAIQLAVEQGGELVAVSVAERLPRYAAMMDEVDEAKAEATAYFAQVHREAYDRAKQAGIELRATTLVGHAAQQLVQYATAERVDLLVLGHSGHSGVWGQFLGTTADKVVRHAPCSVLVVR